MTMANTTTVPSPLRAGVSLRKTNKPLMEKRRRARINDSLSQLKSLVIQSSKKDSSQFNKLEKADILELTVKHLRHLQDQQTTHANSNASLAGKYQAGFMECANEVIRYLGQSQSFTDDVKSRVVHHLASCIQLSNKISIAKSTSVQSSHTVPTPPSILPAGLHVTNGQYSNGQVIQIVNSQLQKLKSTNISSYSGIQPNSASAVTPTSTVPAHTSIATTPITTCPTQSSEQSNYIKYTQPLQIQIPPALSPILIQSKSNQYLKSNKPQLIHKPQDIISQNNPHQANPKEKLFSNSPPHSHHQQHMPSLPFRTCQKPSYYTFDDQYHEFTPRSRTYSLTSSSSSTESELSSPLNLSQSPKYYDPREVNPNSQSPVGCHYIQATHQPDIHSTHLASRDTLLLSQCLSSNFASVIVDGRKSAEGHALSYLHFMDEDRHFIHHEGSASPASSVGEERLWRPW